MVSPVRQVVAAAVLAVLATVAASPIAMSRERTISKALSGEPYQVRLVDRDRLDPGLRPALVTLATHERPGTVIIDTATRRLYLVKEGGTAWRFGIGVGATGRGWTGTVTVGRKARWPGWYPTDEMRKAAPGLPSRIPPGTANPLGARALYLYRGGADTLYRIHGTSEPWTVGTEVSSGCFRMLNEDVITLFEQVPVGAKVIVK
jgi:lipoprotein-anchoring transpeptidase ErfK/SrfK